MSQTNQVSGYDTIRTILHDIKDMFPAGSFSDDQSLVTTPRGHHIYHRSGGADITTNGDCTLIMHSHDNVRAKILLHTYFMQNIIVQSSETPELACVLIPGKGRTGWYTYKWDSIELLINYNEYIDHKEEYLSLFKLGLCLHITSD